MNERKTLLSLAVLAAALVATATVVFTERAQARPATASAAAVEVPILMYHRIDVRNASLPAMTQRLTVDPAVFARQMRWLDRNGFRTITQQELHDAMYHGRRLGRKPVLITFDDGYRNVWEKASPVLQELGMVATAYVITSRISNGDPSFLTWANLRSLEARGIEIGSHTVHHRDLRTLSHADLRSELVNSRRALERALGHPVPWFAYPFGGHDARVVRATREAGYRLAVTTVSGTRQHTSAPLELRRLSIIDSTGVAGLAAMLG